MARTSTKTSKTATLPKRATTELPNSLADGSATLKSFRQSDPEDAGFSFTRYWYDGPGLRSGVTSWVMAKIEPGSDPVFGKAAKTELLIPPDAPSIYASLPFLLEHFDKELPPYERHAMVQVKIALPPDEPWHAGYERVREYARAHFANRFPVILVGHVPSTAGLNGYGNHLHCIVLSRPLTINGLQGACHRLCSDKGYAEALAAWRAWRAAEESAA